MSKTAVKIVFDENPIGTKPFLNSDTLASIRQKLNDKIKDFYIFLDQDENPIDIGDENDMTLENIIKDKKIKLKSNTKENAQFNLNIYLNESNILSFNCNKKDKLNDIRNIIYNKIQQNFRFLDEDRNMVDINDEKDFIVEDILNNEIIKITIDSSDNFPPAVPSCELDKNNNKDISKISNTSSSIKKEKFDFSNFEIIKKRGDLTIYKYSNYQNKNFISDKLVYEYFYDDIIDVSNHPYVVSFCGKTGDSKTTAINAFFNIIKGIKVEDNYRFILISEPEKGKGQAESQTDGIHLYYLKDYNDNLVIIIDSQGYGDTRGKINDEKINESFRFVFSNKIDHINTVCFICKTTDSRLDIQTQYIFSSVTSLFSEDIKENFIILATHATKDSIEEGPVFINSIKKDAEFLKIDEIMNEKCWYYFDSKSIYYKDNDILTIHSFEQLTEFYQEKVKKLTPKSIKNCSRILQTRYELKIQVNILKETFGKLIVENKNLKKKQENINDICNKIKDMENQINNFEKEKKSENITNEEIVKKIIELNEQLDKKIDELNNQFEFKEYIGYEKSENLNTICIECKKNCHVPCDCNFNSFYRCKVFSWGIFDYKKCEECGCLKEKHLFEYNYFNKKLIKCQINNDQEKKNAKKKNEEDKIAIYKQLNEKMNNFEKQINKLNDNIKRLLEEKEKNIKEKNEVEKKYITISNEITLTLVKIKGITQRINDLAMNNKHIDFEEKYIKDLKEKMEKSGIKDEEQEKYLKEMEEKHKLFKEANKLSEEDIFKLDVSKLASKLGMSIQNNVTNDGLENININL